MYVFSLCIKSQCKKVKGYRCLCRMLCVGVSTRLLKLDYLHKRSKHQTREISQCDLWDMAFNLNCSMLMSWLYEAKMKWINVSNFIWTRLTVGLRRMYQIIHGSVHSLMLTLWLESFSLFELAAVKRKTFCVLMSLHDLHNNKRRKDSLGMAGQMYKERRHTSETKPAVMVTEKQQEGWIWREDHHPQYRKYERYQSKSG